MRYFQRQLLISSVLILLAGMHLCAQQGQGVRIAITWHTISDSTYGIRYWCAWNDATLRIKGVSAPGAPIVLHVNRIDVGIFEITSNPIAVTGAGMTVAFTRTVEMVPSAAERGTVLPNDPKDRCRNNALGVTRAGFHQRVDVLDAATHAVLANVDVYRFRIGRDEALNDMSYNKRLEFDLTPFAGKTIILRGWTSTGYNGRGPSRATDPLTTMQFEHEHSGSNPLQ